MQHKPRKVKYPDIDFWFDFRVIVLRQLMFAKKEMQLLESAITTKLHIYFIIPRIFQVI